MKNILFLLSFLLFSLELFSQPCTTLVAFNRAETSNWNNVWLVNNINVGTLNLTSNSPTRSFFFSGFGTGSSAVERDTLKFENKVLNSSNSHIFKFKVASRNFFNPTSLASGVDAPDFIRIAISSNGGTSFTNEIEIKGFNNALWTYNSLVISKTANGVMTSFSPPYGEIVLNIPAGISQLSINVIHATNALGEEWWTDDYELFEVDPCILPLELSYFKGSYVDSKVELEWQTFTESEGDYFEIEKSSNGIDWKVLETMDCVNSNNLSTYIAYDKSPEKGLNYYRLNFVNYSGVKELGKIIVVETPNKMANIYYDGEVIYFKDIYNEYKIYDFSGKLVKSGEYTPEILTTELPRGCYTISFEGSNNATMNFVK